MKHVSTIGLDLAKYVFQVHGADIEGSPLFNRKLRRGELLRFFEKQPPCLIGIEACGGGRARSRSSAMTCASYRRPRSSLSSSAERRTRPMLKPSARR